VEKIVEVPVERIVEVEKIVEVLPPPRTSVVTDCALEPVGAAPPARVAGSVFDNVGRDRLAALEAAARRELNAVKNNGFGIAAKIFGRKG
jgi:hypothetical protein